MKKSPLLLMIRFVSLVLVTVSFFSVSQVLAQDEFPGAVTDDEVNSIAKEMYCPVCESTPLDVCPTSACEDWRQDIRDKLEEGWSETQIKEYFVNRYGDRVLAVPPARGFNWIIYLTPPIAILAGAGFLFYAMVQWRQKSAKANRTNQDAVSQGAAPQVSDPEGDSQESSKDDVYINMLEEELKKR